MGYTVAHIVPRRIFLDTCTVQAIADCGGYIFGEDAERPFSGSFLPDRCPQVVKRSDAAEILDSLRWIFLMNERAMFDWIVSPRSIEEVDRADNPSRSRYVRDILDHSTVCLAENPPSEAAKAMVDLASGPYFAFISSKDRQLLIDAVAAECDAFLTIEKRLPRVADAVLKQLPLLIVTPMTLWQLLEPHMKGL